MIEGFTKGLPLAESFYRQAAQPILETHFPQVPYSAALIGWGSEVLGYDDDWIGRPVCGLDRCAELSTTLQAALRAERIRDDA